MFIIVFGLVFLWVCLFFFFFQAEDGIRDAQESRGLGDVYKRQALMFFMNPSSDIIEFTLYPVNFFSSDLAPCLASLSTMLTSLSLVLSFFFSILFSFSSMFSLRIRLICLVFLPTFPPIRSDF